MIWETAGKPSALLKAKHNIPFVAIHLELQGNGVIQEETKLYGSGEKAERTAASVSVLRLCHTT